MIPLLLLLAGCTFTMRFPPPEQWDTGDSGTAAGRFDPVQVTVAQVDCDPATGLWTWEARTDGWTRAAELDILDTGEELGWAEFHELRMIDTDPQGDWDLLSVGPLPGATPLEQWEPNLNTVFDCSTDRSTLTFAIRVWNLHNDLTDCIVWGHDADALVSRLSKDQEVAAFGSCLVLTQPQGSTP